MTEPITSNHTTTASEAARIVPRAEFRVFGQDIIERVKARLWNGKTVLGQARRMPAEGYKVFQPCGKFPFPVMRADLAGVLSHLGVDRTPDKEAYTLDEFVGMARADSALVPVHVEKIRYGFTIDGIICEYAQVWFNGAMVESACVESEDYQGMRQVIEGLGIGALPNTNYLEAAKRVVGLV